MAHGPPKRDPRRADDGHLPADGVHVLVLDSSQGARPQPGAHDDGVDRGRVRTAAPEEPGAALDDLRDMLDGTAGDLAAAGEEAREKVGQVDGGVNVDCREGRAGERPRDEGVSGEFLELWVLRVSVRRHWGGKRYTYVGHPIEAFVAPVEQEVGLRDTHEAMFCLSAGGGELPHHVKRLLVNGWRDERIIREHP